MATFAPSRTKVIAISLPMPLAAPVIRATLFSRRIKSSPNQPTERSSERRGRGASFADPLKAVPTRPTRKPPSVDDVVAAVDVEDLAGDQAGGVVGEEGAGGADVVDVDEGARRAP